MNRIIISLLLCIVAFPVVSSELTIEECVSKAESNYPLIKKYDLVAITRDIELSDINKSWLPRLGVYGQITAQNIVPSFPTALSSVLEQMGQDMSGLGKVQYKAGIDVNQVVWDGGSARARRNVTTTRESVRKAAVDVELYTVRQRVENLYFAILLTDRQIERSTVTYNLLLDNLSKLRSMFQNGVAMQSDVDMVEAQTLEVKQSITSARSALSSYRKALELFIGETLDDVKFVCPPESQPIDTSSNRPELSMFQRRIEADNASLKLTDTSVMPKVGFFAQAYYGYPGFNYFKSMINRQWSFNIMAGLKVSWNIDAFYTKKNLRRRTETDIADIAVERDLFMFNTNIQAQSTMKNIDGLWEIIKDDNTILELRSKVRQAAESQLRNGIIDTTALLSKISDENVASLNASFHYIQLIQEIYNLKYTLNQ
ncbi:MAG: TolC family protein [Muribaculaceae bacterium]|nr:TolC family protein [Muribaculaceae bacterium]